VVRGVLYKLSISVCLAYRVSLYPTPKVVIILLGEEGIQAFQDFSIGQADGNEIPYVLHEDHFQVYRDLSWQQLVIPIFPSVLPLILGPNYNRPMESAGKKILDKFALELLKFLHGVATSLQRLKTILVPNPKFTNPNGIQTLLGRDEIRKDAVASHGDLHDDGIDELAEMKVVARTISSGNDMETPKHLVIWKFQVEIEAIASVDFNVIALFTKFDLLECLLPYAPISHSFLLFKCLCLKANQFDLTKTFSLLTIPR
jgi:hypothetical protein